MYENNRSLNENNELYKAAIEDFKKKETYTVECEGLKAFTKVLDLQERVEIKNNLIIPLHMVEENTATAPETTKDESTTEETKDDSSEEATEEPAKEDNSAQEE